MTNPALVLIDLQKAIDRPAWGQRNNPRAEEKIAVLLEHWRENSWPIYHVKHNSIHSNSTYRPGQTGNDFKPDAMPMADEVIVEKTTNSAFIGTDLEQQLRSSLINNIVIVGVITNNSVETTVRHAGNLGFNVRLVEDACFTFGQKDWNGVARSADDVHAMSLSNLSGEYCEVVKTKDIFGE